MYNRKKPHAELNPYSWNRYFVFLRKVEILGKGIVEIKPF
jgi:hypothetical protein